MNKLIYIACFDADGGEYTQFEGAYTSYEAANKALIDHRRKYDIDEEDDYYRTWIETLTLYN